MQSVFTGGVVSKFAMSCVPPLLHQPEPVDRVVAIVGGAAFALQQGPVHGQWTVGQLPVGFFDERRCGAASSQTITRPYIPDCSCGSGPSQVNGHVAAAIDRAARREDVHGLVCR